MVDHPTPDWIGPSIGAVGAVFAGVLGWLGLKATAKAAKPAADPQAVQNEGWNELLGQMRLELKATARERNEFKALLARREAEWATERDAFKGQIAQLQAVAEGFERLLRRAMAGEAVSLPERKVYAPEAPRVVQTTLRQDGRDDE